MSLRTTIKGDVAIVSPNGMLTGGDETERLERELRGLIVSGRRKILLDLGRTRHLSSTAISSLVSVRANAASNGVAFYTCNVDKRIESVLAILMLVRLLNVYGTREDALEALAKVDPASSAQPVPAKE